ncbi:MAG: NeuD/PglB/VioB family sugar acetyltransferase [Gemmatimonadota bacterium]
MRHYIVGSGGQARVIASVVVAAGHDTPLFVNEAELAERYTRGDRVLVGIGDNSVRERVVKSILAVIPECEFGTAIHPNAQVATDVDIGKGSVLMAGAVVNTASTIGGHVIINTNSSIDHDCAIADYASIAPGVAIGGTVKVGRGAFIGIGAAVVHGCEIGDYTVVGAGSAVISSLPPYSVCLGVPATVIRDRAAGEPYL